MYVSAKTTAGGGFSQCSGHAEHTFVSHKGVGELWPVALKNSHRRSAATGEEDCLSCQAAAAADTRASGLHLLVDITDKWRVISTQNN